MSNNQSNGLLTIEVKAPPIIAGTRSTVSLIIRNPFDSPVIVELVEAPTSAPLLPSALPSVSREKPERSDSSFLDRLKDAFRGFEIRQLKMGLLTAEFPGQTGRTFAISLEQDARLEVKSPFGPTDRVSISAEKGAIVVIDNPDSHPRDNNPESKERQIPAHQEDLARFELKTSRWLLVKPKQLELHALVKFRVGDDARSQVVPINLALQPPVRSIVFGAVSGGILGWIVRQLNNGHLPFDFPALVSILGTSIMCWILAIVLSRQESSKGFVTLEDFYGAFVAGTIVGYTGTNYFESVLNGTAAVAAPHKGG
ncbi:hypothetical protein ACFPTO_21575 [Paraburkholderia denitrificans]|uniref:Uncharacterized protein n=1 Tax=Paraburkholderia denitrificans TaxID=694025 RepID=A0ABW0JEQ5_9BURK